ncbi:MAG TPA: hypothetical protein VG965_01100 [Patescibacteria group bacterium]|nr:hypothetical protein [Patescibacteria group bacterium]
MDKNKAHAILFLDRSRLDVYIDQQPAVLSFPFAENVISSLEVINPQELENQLNAFIAQNNIPPLNINLILSVNVVFEKDLPEGSAEQQAERVQTFLDSLPFEEIETKLLTFPQGARIVAVNKKLFQSILFVFEKLGSTTSNILPYEVLGQEGATVNFLDATACSMLLKKNDSFASYAFPHGAKPVPSSQQPSKKVTITNAPVNKTRLYIMVGVFAFLILIMVVLLLRGGK